MQSLFIVFLVFLLCSSAHSINILPDVTAPDISIITIDGKVVSLSDYYDMIIVFIWRTDQKRSLLALKDGQDILTRYKDKDVKVLGLIAGTENLETVYQILNESKF